MEGASTPIIVRDFNIALIRMRCVPPGRGQLWWALAAGVRLDRGSPEWECDDAQGG